MKLALPPIQIEEFEGFTPEKDIFQRKIFGEQLYGLLDNVDDELVLAIDAPWGEGKTTFVKMWMGLLHSHGVKSVYFDAYSNDFVEDPFLAMVGELQALLDGEDTQKFKEKFKEKAISALKVFGRTSIRVGIKAVTAGVLDETLLEGAGTGDELASITDQFIAKRLEAIDSDKRIIEEFRAALEELAVELGGGQKLVFIVDELDRCKPSFALHLIEKVKHVLSVPSVVFVLVLNRRQMEEIIKSTYGGGIDSVSYLQKFVHLWAGLPKNTDQHTNDAKKYLNYCLNRMDYEIKTGTQQNAIEIYGELVFYYNMSPREIERSLSNFAIIHNITDGNLIAEYVDLTVFLSITKIRYPKTYQKLRFGQITYEQVISQTELGTLEDDWWKKQGSENHYLKWLIKFCLSSGEEANAMVEATEHRVSRGFSQSAITDICSWLDSFSR